MTRAINKSAAIRLLLRSDPDLAPQEIIDRLAMAKLVVTKDHVKAVRLRLRRGSKTNKLTAAEIQIVIENGWRYTRFPTFDDVAAIPEIADFLDGVSDRKAKARRRQLVEKVLVNMERRRALDRRG